MNWVFQVHVMLVLVWDIDGITWGWSNFYLYTFHNQLLIIKYIPLGIY
jgi:hypothetical protein